MNAEFSETEARKYAEKYAHHVGRLPKILRTNIDYIAIHDGHNPWGGAPGHLIVHTGQGDSYEANHGGILDETLVHEAAHASIDGLLYHTDEWNAAVAADGRYISDYARDYPQREDVAETYLVWLATRYSQDEFTEAQLD